VFFAGIAVIALIDKFVPSAENPHEIRDVKDMKKENIDDQALLRMGMFSALAIAIHNFPEGIAVSVPIYFATDDRKKAFLYSFLSGLSEPVGAIVGYFILMRFFNGRNVWNCICWCCRNYGLYFIR